MGIQKITQLATNVLSKVQKMPLPKQLGLATLATTGVFGLGVLIGEAIFGDSFEKEKEQLTNLEQQNNTLVQQNDSLNNELNKLKEKIQAEEKEKSTFKYVPPSGDDIKADTVSTYIRAGNSPATIEFSKNGKPFEAVHYTYDGKFDGYSSIVLTGKNQKRFENRFDKDGKWYSRTTETEDGYIEEYKDTRVTNKGNKTIEEFFDNYIDPENKVTEKTYMDEKLIEEKRYKEGVLQYTVTPKYNKDDDLIKRDTVWVNK